MTTPLDNDTLDNLDAEAADRYPFVEVPREELAALVQSARDARRLAMALDGLDHVVWPDAMRALIARYLP